MGQRANSPATGGPGITGTVQAGETLTATTDGIEDEDGLTGAVFAYQWVRSDTDIEGAASSTYTMTGDDEGKPIQVRVTFSDDAGNEESLTSYARLSGPPLTIRDAGVIASNTPATGEPTITGTAQVGETLTADAGGCHGHIGQRRPDQRLLHIPVAGQRRHQRLRQLWSEQFHVHASGIRRGQDHHGAGVLH